MKEEKKSIFRRYWEGQKRVEGWAPGLAVILSAPVSMTLFKPSENPIGFIGGLMGTVALAVGTHYLIVQAVKKRRATAQLEAAPPTKP